MVRWICASVVAVGTLGCGEQDPSSPVAVPLTSSVSTTGVEGGSSETALVDPADVPPALPDLPPQTKSCEARGTDFGIIVGPIDLEIPPLADSVSNVALTASTSGLLVSYRSLEVDGADFELFGLQVRDDGGPRGSPWAFTVAGTTPSFAVKTDRLLMMHCEHGEVGLRAFDALGSSLGSVLTPVGLSRCQGPVPGGGWTEIGFLAAWYASPTEVCPDGCIALSFGRDNVLFNTRSLGPVHIATDPPAMGVAERAVLIVASQVNPAGENELLLSLVEPGGTAIFPPMMESFPSLNPDGPQPRAPVGVGVDHTGRFVVFVGGRGPSFGRLRLSPIATVTEPFEDVAFEGELQVLDALTTKLTVARRIGGYVVHGPARVQTEDGPRDGILAAMVGDHGTLHSYEFFDGAQDAAVATQGNRTFMVIGGAGLAFAELGCLL